MSRPQDEVDVDESSGITTLLPVPTKPARLFELAESDSTSYFSASELLERGKALAARTAESSAQPTPDAAPEPEVTPPRQGWLTQFRRASFAKKASALLLPLTCALLLGKPLFKKSAQEVVPKPSASVAAASVPPPPRVAPAETTETPPALVLPRGVTVAHAAADSVATGDFARALGLYRELSRREPQNLAYREAARILGERNQTRSP